MSDTIVSVDLSSALPAQLASLPGVVADIARGVTEQIRAEIIRLANERLHLSSEDYIQGLQPARYHDPNAGSGVFSSIVLTGWLPNAVEHGWSGGDMKEALLKGRNAKVTPKGVRYNTVPFRHGTPGTRGTNFPAMGSAYAAGFGALPGGGFQAQGTLEAAQAAKLGRRVHKAAKALEATRSHPDKGTQWGGRLEAGLAPLLRPHHKTDIYAGMVRERKVYQHAEQSQYSTFRRVSDNSDPGSWIHPGIEGHRLFDEGAKVAAHAAKVLVDAALRTMS